LDSNPISAVLTCVGLPNDISCPEKDTHLPCCTRCTDGFALISELELKTKKKLRNLKLKFALDPSSVPPIDDDNGEDSSNTSCSKSSQPEPPKASCVCSNAVCSSAGGSCQEPQELMCCQVAVTATINRFSNSSSEDSDSEADCCKPPPIKKTCIEKQDLSSCCNVNEQQRPAAPWDNLSSDDDDITTTTTVTTVTPSDPPPAPRDWAKATAEELKLEFKRRKLKIGTRKKKVTVGVLSKLIVEDIQKRGEPGAQWVGLKNGALKEECKRHGLTIGGKKQDLLDRLHENTERAALIARSTIAMRELSDLELVALQELEELLYGIGCRRDNLSEYRSHMARHLSEDVWGADLLEKLGDDEAVVTSDYKMKILSCFFRENQKKWFGKRGTSLLGFMIASNASDEESRAKGIKEVTFVMMITDDCLQDDWEVACAKSVLYKEYLPAHVTKVHFVSDGAGCFKSMLHRALQPFWKLWTGIDEVTYRITPAGDGKSALDGMFGRLNTVLRSTVDEGQSYYNSATIAETIADSNGLASTQFALFEPDRSKQVEVSISTMKFESVLLTTLDPGRAANDQSTVAFKHSGYGEGTRIQPSKDIQFSWRQITGKRKKKDDVIQISGVYNADVSLSICGIEIPFVILTFTSFFTGNNQCSKCDGNGAHLQDVRKNREHEIVHEDEACKGW
jgi:hypothetical protein